MTRTQILTSAVRTYAAIPVFLLCLSLLYLFVSIGYNAVLGPVAGGVVGALAATVGLFYLRLSERPDSPGRDPVDVRIPAVVAGFYVSSLLLTYRVYTYEQPVVHYLLFGAYAGYVAYEIATGAGRARVVPQLLVLTFFTYWSTQLAFPAGAYGPDTKYTYLPAIEQALRSGVVPDSLTIYLGHLVYVTESAVLTGLSAELSYYLLSVLVLAGTLLVLSMLDLALPRIPRQVSLYAALVFGCMSWTLNRGFFPNKLNFFYPLILLVGLAALGVFSATSTRMRRTWLLVGALVTPAIVFGHQFSAGAALVFLVTIGAFSVVAVRFLREEYDSLPTGSPLLFVVGYWFAVLGNPIHQGPLLDRLVGLVQSIFSAGPGGGTGGPGRYSELSLEFLAVNTSPQALLFALTVFGAAVAIRRSDWEYDFGIFWMASLSVLLVVGLVFDTLNTQPQRFYSLLGLFGLNVFAGVTLRYLSRSDFRLFSERTVAVVVVLFAILSLSSPVASIYLSPSGDDVPHFRRYDTHQLTHGSDWADNYDTAEGRVLNTVPPSTELPVERATSSTVRVDWSRISPGTLYAYSDSAATSGVLVSGGLSLGGRNYAFFILDRNQSDGVVYTNGGHSVYLRQ